MIKLNSLCKKFGQIVALDDLNLAVNKGELFAFLGPNGAGKTTTIRILNGLTKLDSGQALIADVDIEKNPLKAKRLCGLAAQNINLDMELTVLENLDIHGRLYGMTGGQRHERSKILLEYVELADRADDFVKNLSGGLKRRLMIARALMHEPQLLFLDEPTVGLDPAIRRRIWGLIKKVQKDGMTIFLTTHYIEEAEFLADRVAFIHHGQLVKLGVPSEIMAQLGHWAVDYYGESEMETAYFNSRDEANKHMQKSEFELTLRRVNLEDAFLAITGKKVK